MRKHIYFYFCLALFFSSAQAQVTFTLASGSICWSGSNNQTAGVTSSPAGSTSYSWTASSGTCATTAFGANPVITLGSCCGVYTVTCYAMNAGNVVIGTSTQTMTVTCPGWLTVNSPPAMCAGASATLVAGGGMTYTWVAGSTPQFTFVGGSAIVSPLVSTCFTLTGNNMQCTTQTFVCVVVNPVPNIGITGNSTACPGMPTVLTATGNAVAYAWSMAMTGSTVSVNASSNSCYTVHGASASGCTNTASFCVTVLPTGITVNSPKSVTVCAGSSASFTASGGSSYTWNTGASTSTVNVLTPAAATYTVSGLGQNGCIGTDTANVFVNPACADVWPGDANSDGIVNSTDVLELGLAFSATGAARTPGGNVYTSQYANSWTGTVSSGKNKCHADCNGDGTVDNLDTVAIFNNYLLSHSFKPSGSASVGDILLLVNQNAALEGTWNKADIMLGTSSNPVNQVYGITFDIDFDNTWMEPGSVYVSYSPSFLNASSQNIQFRKPDFANGKIYAASVRAAGNEVSGNGKIGEFWFKLKPNVPTNTTLNLSVSHTTKINGAGTPANLTGSSTDVAIVKDLVGLKEESFANSLHLYPNPASGRLVLHSDLKTTVAYTVLDITGRAVATGTFNGSQNLDISNLQDGVYLIGFESGQERTFKKLVVEK